VIPIIAVIVVMIPTYRASMLQSKLTEYREKAYKAANPEDSLKAMEEFKKTYGEDLDNAKKNQLKLGLDLRGGMYVTLEVDVLKLIVESAQRESIDETFQQVVDKTRDEIKTSDKEVIEVFLKYFNQIAKPKGKSMISYFDVGDIRDASEEKIISKLRTNAKDAIDQAVEVIRQRIDQFGVSEPNIQQVGNSRLILELPGVENNKQMRDLIQTTARLEFNLVRNNEEIVRAFAKIDKILADQNKRKNNGMTAAPAVDSSAQIALNKVKDSVAKTAAKPLDKTKTADTSSLAKADTSKIDSTAKAKQDTANPYAGMSEEQIRIKHTAAHPFTSLFATYFIPKQENASWVPFYYVNDQIPEGEYSFKIVNDSLAKFNEILKRSDIKVLIPTDLKVVVEAKPDKRTKEKSGVEVYEFYSLKRDPELTGEVIVDAQQSFDPTTNAPMVNMTMNDDGSERWSRITGANLKKRIAIVLDDRVYSAPVVQAKITGGRSQITGQSNSAEARLLEVVLKAGALKAPVVIVEERIVGPSLGQDSINTGIIASLVAMLFVILYMALYYGKGGVVADIAVFINIAMIIGFLAALKGTLTLPGIAGIVLTMGMAVDANVLIFERIREELARGRSLRSAIDEGFSKALSAIIDSNVTTAITSFILLVLGTGPIQGFATTLLIGIITTLFTAIMVSRALIEMMLSKGATEFNFGQPKYVPNA
jgi:protein-export membrane protein SecD